MKTLSADTDPLIEQMQLAIMARLPAWRKIELVAGMNAMLSAYAVSEHKRYDANITDLWRYLDQQRLNTDLAQCLETARQERHISPEEKKYMAGDPIPATFAVIAALNQLDVPYFIGGSLASSVHGLYRATADANIIADLSVEQVDHFVALLTPQFYVDAEMIRDAIQHGSSFNILDVQSGFKVDIFISRQRPFDHARFARRILEPLSDSAEHRAYVATAEDTVLAKLEWYRAGGEVSEQQWRDIIGILKVKAANLDQDYLRSWAAELYLSDLLDRVLSDSAY